MASSLPFLGDLTDYCSAIVFTGDHVHTEDTKDRVTALSPGRQFLRHISIYGHRFDETCRFRRSMAFYPSIPRMW